MPATPDAMPVDPAMPRDAVKPNYASRLACWLETERDGIPLLIPVIFACGIAIWESFGDGAAQPLFGICLGLVVLGISQRRDALPGGQIIIAALLLIFGFANIAVQSRIFGAGAIERPWVGSVTALVESVEPVSARGIIRYRLNTGGAGGLPTVVRVNVADADALVNAQPGAIIRIRVRLMPPPAPALPGGYDFARTAWFNGIGATGRAIGPMQLVAPARISADFWGQARNGIAADIEQSMTGATGSVGSALLVGTRGGIVEEDAEALRNSGMAHLLSVSGLHVTAVVGGSYVLLSAILALLPWLALRIPVPLIAAAGSALIAIGYTLLTGAEVPTIRACVAALLILAAMAIGREPLSLRLLAAGATFVLLFWPEALAGPSFQLSFAAVGTIILLHENRKLQNWMRPEGQHTVMRLLRGFGMMLVTGLSIELALAPIALYHFNKSGLYGALANMVAIPLTTFVIMPTQLFGLCADAIIDGLGAPFWWLASNGIAGILWLAYKVSAAPGAVVLLPEMPGWAFATTIFSALFIAIFSHRRRWILLLPLLVALWAMVASPQPDMLVTGDGQHLAVLGSDSKLALLRPGAGDYARSILGETAAVAGKAQALDTFPGAKCNSDGCSFLLDRGGRKWRVLALRSNYRVPAMELAAACVRSDIVISQRRLPWSCEPAWLKADAALLEKSGGLAFYLPEARVTTVAETNAYHPWSVYAPERLARKSAEREKAKAARIPEPPKANVAAMHQ